MKRIRLIELLAEVKANLVPFVSIALFICLGIGLFLGMQWSGTSMCNSIDANFDEGVMHDIEIQFPYGVRQSDVEDMKQIEGVTDVEPGYACTENALVDGANIRFLVQNLTERMDLPMDVEGELPATTNEIALLKSWAEDNEVSIGDTISFAKADSSEDSSKGEGVSDDEERASGTEHLTNDTFVVTALINHPANLSKVSAVGVVDTVGFVLGEVFDAESFEDGYPNAFVRCDGLRGLSSFSEEYKSQVDTITKALEGLGATLSVDRYDEVQAKAQEKIEEGQGEIDDAEKKLADAKQDIADGGQELKDAEKKLADGEEELAESKRTAKKEKADAEQKLADAKSQLEDAERQYDEGVAEYKDQKAAFDKEKKKFDKVSGNYDTAMANYYALLDRNAELEACVSDYDEAIAAYAALATSGKATPKQLAEAWSDVLKSYQAVVSAYDGVPGMCTALVENLSVVGSEFGKESSGSFVAPSLVEPDQADPKPSAVAAHTASAAVASLLDNVYSTEVSIQGETYKIVELGSALEDGQARIDSAKDELDAAKDKISNGWATYENGQQELKDKIAEAKQQYADAKKELEDGRQTIQDKKQELADAKQEVKEKSAELADAKAELADAEEQYLSMVQYEWLVSPRPENPSMQSADVISVMMSNARWAMALLFLLVGLLVCYSSVSRLVHDEAKQIGTKKALGFREGEIGFLYLAFTGLSVVLGVILAGLVATFVVQGILNPRTASPLGLPAFPLHFDLVQLIGGGLVELALILMCTWFATHSLLKRNAVDLLSGNQVSEARTRFYENTKLWQRMPLLSQTIVNNCVNDRRRIIATLIGVIGCTALIVTAVTLQTNVSRTVDLHYENVYSFDAYAYLDEDDKNAAATVGDALLAEGVDSTPVHREMLRVRQANGYRAAVTLFVPEDFEDFSRFYHMNSTTGNDVDINEGIWLSASYANHMNLGVGDEVKVYESTGESHSFTVGGVFEFYLLRSEFILSADAYYKSFGEKPTWNALLADSGGANFDELRKSLRDVPGYEGLVDDSLNSHHSFNQLARVLQTVVLIYLMLAAVMAAAVLFNLDTMFVDEKKRELIVLMINGFSARDAKAYIYRDSIVLTAIGIAIGVAFGSLMGLVSLVALEPSIGCFVKEVNVISVLSGVLGAGLFASIALLLALRRIPRFKLADINRA